MNSPSTTLRGGASPGGRAAAAMSSHVAAAVHQPGTFLHAAVGAVLARTGGLRLVATTIGLSTTAPSYPSHPRARPGRGGFTVTDPGITRC